MFGFFSGGDAYERPDAGRLTGPERKQMETLFVKVILKMREILLGKKIFFQFYKISENSMPPYARHLHC